MLATAFCWYAYESYQASKTIDGRFAAIHRVTGLQQAKGQDGRPAVSVSDVCYGNTWSFKTGEKWKKQCVRRETRYFDFTGSPKALSAALELLSRNGWDVETPAGAYRSKDKPPRHGTAQVDIWNGGWSRGGIEEAPHTTDVVSMSEHRYNGPLPAGRDHIAIAMALDDTYLTEY